MIRVHVMTPRAYAYTRVFNNLILRDANQQFRGPRDRRCLPVVGLRYSPARSLLEQRPSSNSAPAR
jgi:hypothetical protein